MVNKKLNGLVLMGGHSTRMKKDKSRLDFHGKPQFAIAYSLLNKICNQTYISIREDQKDEDELSSFCKIIDNKDYSNKGPMGGILSAFSIFPDHAWLVLAVDLPFVNKTTLDYLIKNRNSSVMATAFKSSYDNLPEPLCAIYEPKAYIPMQKQFFMELQCPRKFLINNEVELIEQPLNSMLNNINSPEDYNRAINELKNN